MTKKTTHHDRTGAGQAAPPDLGPGPCADPEGADPEGWGWAEDDWDDGEPWAASGLGPDDDLPEYDDTPLTTPDDLLTLLLRLVGPERSGGPALWAVLTDAERRPVPLVLPFGEVPLVPDAASATRLVAMLGETLAEVAPGGSLAFAIVRAAGGDRGRFERDWAHALRVAADEADVHLLGLVAIGASRARTLEW